MTQAANLGALGTNVSSSGITQAAGGGTAGTAGVTGFKNRLINGAMVIDQRNAGAAVTVNAVGIFCTDRWACIARPTGGGVYSAQQVSDAPVGFSNSLKLTVTTADTSLGTSDYYFFWQKIEGYNTADLMFGTANARTVTLSFWVKSNITGQFSAFLTNATEVYNQPFAYTINAANTWEYKTITFTGATAGTWIGATNGVGLNVGFGLANGTSLQGTSGVWTASSVYGSTGDVNWMATNGNTFQITGVQLEVGSAATNFDVRSFGTELALCQRYFQGTTNPNDGNNYYYGSGSNLTTSIAYITYPFLVSMRASPTLTSSGTFYIRGGGNSELVTAVSLVTATTTTAGVNFTVGGATLTQGYGVLARSSTATANTLFFSAEL